MTTAVLFFCHGSRDPLWRVPMDQIVAEFRGMHATRLCELAFLEFMEPSFEEAVERLVAQHATRIRVIPLFLARGAHLRRDLDDRVDAAQLKHPSVAISVAPALGEVDSIRAAIASWVAQQV
ncbi:MAG: CbiX/SirB N-terminal domain-containing protein [Casimicrobiaceae bacterium]|nr:CbiX/SirB N-terminal domain-containing protein [Casimicrobiaceae bacterium]MDW8312933.1 CbiX/SirB N-terminal domain-containing protein [Burkholderiales bacterium]